MIILGIETSCDETAISILKATGDLKSPVFKVLGSSIHSQIDIHKEYGGVFPTLAKREHIRNLPIVYKEALNKAGVAEKDIDIIAVTVGPGLEPALWTGINFGEKLGKEWGKPVIGVNHMMGHIASVLYSKTDEFSNTKIEWPAIALLISGGHTELVLLYSWKDKKKIGETQDDAVGEAFDKVARMLGLPYPGGPEISKLAEEARVKDLYLEKKLPRPMIHSKNLNFSFSGLKTAVLYYLRNITEARFRSSMERGQGNFQQKISVSSGSDISKVVKLGVAREFEDAVIETLLFKTKKAIKEYNPKTLIIGGGVIANKALRENFLSLNKDFPDLKIMIPEKELTTDNATMMAMAGFIEYLQKNSKKFAPLKAQGNLDV